MEKPGMGRRRPLAGAGLLDQRRFGLLLLGFLLSGAVLDAQTDPADEPLTVEIGVIPDTLYLNVPFRIVILTDYPFAGEVAVHVPPLPPSLNLEEARTEPRFSPDGAQRSTATEFLFTPRQGGELRLGAFEVIAGGKRALTEALTLFINGGREEPRLLWDPLPRTLTTGEEAVLSLRFTGGSPPDLANLAAEAPVNAILEILPHAAGDTRFRIRLIPLDGPALVLEGIRLDSPNRSLTAPGIRIPVLPAEETPSRRSVDRSLPPEATPSAVPDDPAIPFPAPDPPGFFLIRPGYERSAAQARELWEGDNRAEALALLRRDERDLIAGPALAVLRRSVEDSLGIGLTADETWRPRRLYLARALIPAGLLAILLIRRRSRKRGEGKKTVTSGLSRRYKDGIIIVALPSLILLLLAGGFGFSPAMINPSNRSASAVLRSSPVYRVPDAAGAAVFYFSEGQPVIIHAAVDHWAYVESSDGRAGWTAEDNLISY
jgi:hypothetical protein